MVGYDEAGITQTSELDWASVDANVFGVIDTEFAEWKEQQGRMLSNIWQWVHQGRLDDIDGFHCRCIIVNWAFNELNWNDSMTEVAGQFGKKKQSISRWLVEFKKSFPDVVKHLPHLNNE